MAKSKYKEKEDTDKPTTPVARDGAYVMMLFISLVAIIAGTVMMYLDADEYSGKTPPKDTLVIQKLGEASTTPGGTPPAPPAPPTP